MPRKSAHGQTPRAWRPGCEALGEDAALLRRVDAVAKRLGISRSAWITFKVSEALDAGGA
jgi:hypothetical protein